MLQNNKLSRNVNLIIDNKEGERFINESIILFIEKNF
jgi:hypothetical protein